MFGETRKGVADRGKVGSMTAKFGGTARPAGRNFRQVTFEQHC